MGIVSNYEFQVKNFNADSKNSAGLKNKKEHNFEGIFQFNSKLPLKKDGKKFNTFLLQYLWLN